MRNCSYFYVAFQVWCLELEMVGKGMKAGSHNCWATLMRSFAPTPTICLHQPWGIILSLLRYLSGPYVVGGRGALFIIPVTRP